MPKTFGRTKRCAIEKWIREEGREEFEVRGLAERFEVSASWVSAIIEELAANNWVFERRIEKRVAKARLVMTAQERAQEGKGVKGK